MGGVSFPARAFYFGRAMKVYRALAILIFSWSGIGSLLSAEALQWDQRVIEKTATRQEIVKVAFRFKNTSDQQITIQSVTPSCDCTTAELKKNSFAPGEQGQIDVVFNVGDGTGTEFKSITVTTAQDPSDPIELLLKVQIPGLMEITPRLLTWQVGAEPAEKCVDISLVAEPVVTVTGIKSKDPEMETRLETIVPNRQYRLFVKPASTARPRHSTFIITTTTASNALPETQIIYGQVR
jgi:hypothetical protein